MDNSDSMYLQKAYIEIIKRPLVQEENDIAAIAAKLMTGESFRVKSPTTVYQFTVPFNPTELHITSFGEQVLKKTNIQKDKEGNIGATYVYETVKPRRTLSVKLIFDEKDNSLTGVTRKVEGFLAAARSPATRSIFFGWDKLDFYGSLDQVSAAYTIFSAQGIPLRSEVTLNITGN